jgi:hypothetical protein
MRMVLMQLEYRSQYLTSIFSVIPSLKVIALFPSEPQSYTHVTFSESLFSFSIESGFPTILAILAWESPF